MDTGETIAASEPTRRLKALGFWAVFALLVCLHLCKAGSFIAAGQPPLYGDSSHYWSLADRMRQGDWLLVSGTPEVRRTPGYPLFLLPFQALAGSHAMAAVFVVQELMVVLTALIVGWMCWRTTGSRTAACVGLFLSLACVSQNSIAQSLLSDTLLCLLVTSTWACLIVWLERPTLSWAAATGLLLGVATLVKPITQCAWVPIAVVMVLQCWQVDRRRVVRRSLPHVACLIAAMLVVLGPWMLRNQVYFGRPFLVKYLGPALWWSQFKGDPHSSDPAIPFADAPSTKAVLSKLDGVDLHRHYAVFRKLESLGYSHSEIDDMMTAVCLDAVKAYPGEYLASKCRRFAWFWLTPNGTDRPCTGVYRSLLRAEPIAPAEEKERWTKGSYQGQKTWHADWYFQRGGLNWFWYPHPLLYLFAALAAVVATAALIRSPRQRTLGILLGLLFLYFAAVTIVTACPEYRYRAILEPLMIVAVTTGLVAAFQHRESVHQGVL